MTNPDSARTALVVSYSKVASDPRVRRQIDWLLDAGWTLDTIGLDGRATDGVRSHYPLRPLHRWAQGRLGTLVTHLLLPARQRFRLLLTDRVPEAAVARIRAGDYGLVVFNEYEFAPWVGDSRDFTPDALQAQLHLDLHEYRNPLARRRTLGGRITANHYRWVRRHLAHPAFTSRTVVNVPIGRLYAREFGFPEPVPVRNAPLFVDQSPSLVDSDDIRLVFHGMPAWSRGFDQILDAMRVLPERFSMTFMLMPHADRIARLQAAIDAHPARDRMRIVPPAPMRAIAEHINEFDLEIIFYRPIEPNLELALPNKFFEAVQGRLGVIVGESPLMADIVRKYGNGVVVPGFEAVDLAAALDSLTAVDVTRMKEASSVAARELNAEVEGRAFLAAAGVRPTID